MTVVQWYRAPPMAHLNEMWRAQHHSAVCVIPMVLRTVGMEGQNWFACVCVFLGLHFQLCLSDADTTL